MTIRRRGEHREPAVRPATAADAQGRVPARRAGDRARSGPPASCSCSAARTTAGGCGSSCRSLGVSLGDDSRGRGEDRDAARADRRADRPRRAPPRSSGGWRSSPPLVLLFVSWAEVDRTTTRPSTTAACSSPPRACRWSAGRTTSSRCSSPSNCISIPTYVLLYLPARTKLNQEAAAKYFLLSVMSSAVLLFGFSYLYGLTGTTNLTVITDTLAKRTATKANRMRSRRWRWSAIVLVIAAIGFRITRGAVPLLRPGRVRGRTGRRGRAARVPAEGGRVRRARPRARPGRRRLRCTSRSTPNTQVPLLLWILAS